MPGGGGASESGKTDSGTVKPGDGDKPGSGDNPGTGDNPSSGDGKNDPGTENPGSGEKPGTGDNPSSGDDKKDEPQFGVDVVGWESGGVDYGGDTI